MKHWILVLIVFVFCFTIWSCGDDPSSPENSAPSIINLSLETSPIYPASKTNIICNAIDHDGDSLTYEWETTGGTISGSETLISWLAPDTLSTDTITVSVSDGKLSITQSIILSVTNPPEGLIFVPCGTFQQGQDGVATPVHTVNITKGFLLGKYEVTQKEWFDIMGYNNATTQNGMGDNFPVYSIYWFSILVYCNKLSIIEGLQPCYTINGTTDPDSWGTVPTFADTTGTYLWSKVICDFKAKGYRLPTEAEWEYAARFNDDRTYPWGNATYTTNLCNYNLLKNVAVGSYSPQGDSKLGFCDIAGNVLEFCWDYKANYTSEELTDPTGPSSGTLHVTRGGSHLYIVDSVKSACRNISGDCSNTIGFRIARSR